MPQLASLQGAGLNRDTIPHSPSPTFLDAVLQVVDNGCQDSGETHDLGTLGQAKGEELVPAGPHQAGVAVLPGDKRLGWVWVHAGILLVPACPKQVDSTNIS